MIKRWLSLVAIIHTVMLPASAAGGEAPLQLDTVYRLASAEGRQRFITAQDYEFATVSNQIERVAFLAVTTNSWPAGLVPIFMVEKTNRFELRRQPARGQENASEPLFFALPPVDEPEAARIAGRWECVGTRESGSKQFFGWDLATEGESIAGRFDQFTDFRFARIAGGTFRSNRFDLRVEYIMDGYLVRGEWREGKLSGVWWREDESERGQWEATRPAADLPEASEKVTALYEWRGADGSRRYCVEDEEPGIGWVRAARPLCRVWQPKAFAPEKKKAKQ